MREIKFRCWTKEEMLYEGWNGELFVTKAIIFRYDNVQQYTGLKDKNGKDIYEGDIVKGGTRYMRHVKKKYAISVIEYRGAGFWVKDEDFGWEGENLWSWDDLEVIGNIYENPELISDGNKNKSTK